MKQLFDCIEYCKRTDNLPVNIFLLNRNLTELIAKKIPFNLLDNLETQQITKVWNNYLLKYRDVYQHTEQWNFLLNLAQRGIGVHHSGIIPILKEIVEILYEMKLIKVLIATETFAMGVNMPTRTVIFTQTTKYDGNGIRLLRPEEYGQMAGRAGRRGLDDFGTVIILPENKMPSEPEAKKMLMSPPQMINSKLEIDYSFILKRMLILKDTECKSIDYISSSITKTMLASEINKNNYTLEGEIKKLYNDIKEYDNLSEYFTNFLEFKMIENKLENQKNSIFKLSKKVLKKFNNDYKKYCNEFVTNRNKLENWYKVKSKLESLKTELDLSKGQYNYQIEIIFEFLKKHNIVKKENDDYQLTPLGRIVSEVNECNPLILGHIISRNFLNKLEFNEIVAFLSIFIADHSIQEPYISDLEISKEFKDMLNNVSELVNNMLSEETNINNNLPFKFWSNWDLHLSMFNVVLEWAKGNNKWNQVKHLYNTFEGNFCRNILRLVNLMRNVEGIANITNNVELLNKISGYEEKLVRDIVMIDSLYL